MVESGTQNLADSLFKDKRHAELQYHLTGLNVCEPEARESVHMHCDVNVAKRPWGALVGTLAQNLYSE